MSTESIKLTPPPGTRLIPYKDGSVEFLYDEANRASILDWLKQTIVMIEAFVNADFAAHETHKANP